MSVSHRINRIRKGNHRFNRQTGKVIRPQWTRAFQKGRAALHKEMSAEVVDHWLATQRKPLEEVEPIAVLRWLLRKYFAWRGFACRSHCGDCDGKCYASIEYRGTFEKESDARWAANCHGGEVKPVPFNAALPEETVSYGVGDVPQSEASWFYRQGVLLPFAAISREKIERLEAKIRSTDPIVEEMRARAV